MPVPNDYRSAKAHQERLLEDAHGGRRPRRPNRLLALLSRLFGRGKPEARDEQLPARGDLRPLRDSQEHARA